MDYASTDYGTAVHPRGEFMDFTRATIEDVLQGFTIPNIVDEITIMVGNTSVSVLNIESKRVNPRGFD